jgi:hypothetical protein
VGVISVIAGEALACGDIGIGIDEAADFRIVISGLQITEPCLLIVNIPTIARLRTSNHN